MFMSLASTASILRSVFASNRAQDTGGGLCMDDIAHASVLQTQFIFNTAGDFGGAVGLQSTSHAQLTGVLLQGNSAGEGGGAVSVLFNATLTGTQLQARANIAGRIGGAILAGGDATVSLHHCTFQSNTALAGGGALNIGSAATCHIVAATAFNNTASKGGFAAVTKSGVLDMATGTFARNAVGRDGQGGLLYAIGMAVVNMTNCKVSGVAHGSGVWGGALLIDDNVTLTLSECTIADYTAERGGGLVAYGNSSLHAHNCIWRNLTASQFGGAAYLASTAHSSWQGGGFFDTHTQGGGGAINAASGSFDMADVAFENTTGSTCGGAMHIEKEQGAAVNLTRCRFSHCSSGGDGGALCILRKAHVKLLGCNITRCTAAGNAGAVLATGNAVLEMDKCILQYNQAQTHGGAILTQISAHMLASHSSFVDNVCYMIGGGLHVGPNTDLHLEHCIVARNQAKNGGGLSLNTNATLRLESTPVVDNVATGYGGGVALRSSKFSLASLRAFVRSNRAPLDADISAVPTDLAMYSSSAMNGFVSRLRSDEGLWNATLLVTGTQALTSSGVVVAAMMDGSQLTQNKSGEDGLVDLHIKLRKPPGESCTGPNALPLPLPVCVSSCCTQRHHRGLASGWGALRGTCTECVTQSQHSRTTHNPAPIGSIITLCLPVCGSWQDAKCSTCRPSLQSTPDSSAVLMYKRGGPLAFYMFQPFTLCCIAQRIQPVSLTASTLYFLQGTARHPSHIPHVDTPGAQVPTTSHSLCLVPMK
jgi:hypothetical protein